MLLSVCLVVRPDHPPLDALLLALREQSAGPAAIEVVLVGAPVYDAASAEGLRLTVVAADGGHGALRNLAWQTSAPGITFLAADLVPVPFVGKGHRPGPAAGQVAGPRS